MRSVLVVAALAVVAVIALLFMIRDDSVRADRNATSLDSESASRSAGASHNERNAAGAEGASPGASLRGGTARGDGVPHRIRLLYDDGSPAPGITIRCAFGRRLVTKIFRNGDFPEKTIWMITKERSAVTDGEGFFSLPPTPASSEAVLYTRPESAAVLLARRDPVLTEYRAARRAKVTGTLRDRSGKPRPREWLSAQFGRPEDYDMRTHKENDSFVAARGGLEIDPTCKCGGETNERGQFTLLLAPGPNTISFGDTGEAGNLHITVPHTGSLELGDIAAPPPPPAQTSTDPRELRGTVRSLSDAPLDGALVRLWDGNVGAASHEFYADEDGEWHVAGLHGHRVIAWALSSDRRHMVLPEQSSGTIPMPCNTPVPLVAPSEDEYAWVKAPGVTGFFLFVRNDVFLGAEPLAADETIGLPQGKYRIFAVTDSGVVALETTLRGGGEQALTGFR